MLCKMHLMLTDAELLDTVDSVIYLWIDNLVDYPTFFRYLLIFSKYFVADIGR